LRANVNTRSSTGEEPQKIGYEVTKVLSERGTVFDEAVAAYPEDQTRILELKRTLLMADKAAAMNEKSIIAQVYKSPYPGAYTMYLNESGRLFSSSTRTALYHGQLRVNESVSYSKSLYENEINARLKAVTAEISRIDSIVPLAGAATCGIKLGGL